MLENLFFGLALLIYQMHVLYSIMPAVVSAMALMSSKPQLTYRIYEDSCTLIDSKFGHKIQFAHNVIEYVPPACAD